MRTLKIRPITKVAQLYQALKLRCKSSVITEKKITTQPLTKLQQKYVLSSASDIIRLSNKSIVCKYCLHSYAIVEYASII